MLCFSACIRSMTSPWRCGARAVTVISRPLLFSSNIASTRMRYTSLALIVKTDVPGSDEEVRLLDRFLSTEFIIRRKQLVESNGDVQVEAVIKRLEKVSQTSRLWWGSLAGSARLRVDVTVTRKPSSVMNFTLDTEAQGASSTGDWWSGHGGSIEDMLQRSAVKIVDEILKRLFSNFREQSINTKAHRTDRANPTHRSRRMCNCLSAEQRIECPGEPRIYNPRGTSKP